MIFSVLAVTGLNAMPAMAAADIDSIRFECPNASGGTPSERLTNYGSYIRGMGEENYSGIKILPIFSGVPTAGVPINLAAAGYSHAGTQYNPSTGRITCLFTSAFGNDSFNVSYSGQNVKNGWVVKSDNSAITINVLTG